MLYFFFCGISTKKRPNRTCPMFLLSLFIDGEFGVHLFRQFIK